MRREIARLHRQLSATMVYVTHDQVEAMTLGDRIVVMSAGEVQQIGTPLDVYDLPRNTFVAGFIGSPPMNLIPGAIGRDGGLRFRADDGAFELSVPERSSAALSEHDGAPVILGIRPEHLQIATAQVDAGIEARLDLVEPMGSELYLSLRAGTHDLTARVSPRSLPPAGSSLLFTVDPEHLHFFDAQSTLRLG
jgi:multiple sugar transport system ATP-binding protein